MRSEATMTVEVYRDALYCITLLNGNEVILLKRHPDGLYRQYKSKHCKNTEDIDYTINYYRDLITLHCSGEDFTEV